MGSITREVVGRMRRSSAWTALRAAGQRKAFDELLRRVLAAEGGYAAEAVKAEVRRRTNERRPLSPSGVPGVVAFGARDWEELGLWQAISRRSRFSFVDKMAPRTGVWVRTESAQRERLGRILMDHVESREKKGESVHLVFFGAGGSEIGPTTLRELHERGIATVMLCLDDRQIMPGRKSTDLVDWQLEVAREIDVYWTSWRLGADWLQAEGARPWYAPEAADAGLFAPRQGPKDIDVLFIGGAYGSRLNVVRRLKAFGVQVVARGGGWPDGPVSFPEMIDLVGRADIVLGVGGVGAGDGIRCLKGRDFEMPMAGALYLTGFNPELAEFFEIGNEVLCYHEESDLLETIAWLRCRARLKEGIRLAARRRAERDHTWGRRIEDLFQMVWPSREVTSEAGRDDRRGGADLG